MTVGAATGSARSGCGVDCRERIPRPKTIGGETPLPKNECGGPTTVPSPCLSRP